MSDGQSGMHGLKALAVAAVMVPLLTLAACGRTDTRIPASQEADASGINTGGGVEVYPTAALATARAKYLQTIFKAAPIFGTEYDYISGGVLVRVSGLLTPTQAADYGKAMGAKLYKLG